MSKIDNLIKSLGQTPKEIADSLRNKGIKGYRSAGTSCPIAVFLRMHNAFDPKWDTVTQIRITSEDERTEDYYLPQCVEDFIKRFDAGEYPELDITRNVT